MCSINICSLTSVFLSFSSLISDIFSVIFVNLVVSIEACSVISVFFSFSWTCSIIVRFTLFSIFSPSKLDLFSSNISSFLLLIIYSNELSLFSIISSMKSSLPWIFSLKICLSTSILSVKMFSFIRDSSFVTYSLIISFSKLFLTSIISSITLDFSSNLCSLSSILRSSIIVISLFSVNIFSSVLI